MISFNKFNSNLEHYLDLVVGSHKSLKVNSRSGTFIVMPLKDYQAEQETLYVLQNCSLMKQISKSIQTFNENIQFTS